jgi:predicted NodU family carbamoyl transferase
MHVVRSTDNPLFWKLLNDAGQKAPAPILVNTSFNLFGEPLMVTPRGTELFLLRSRCASRSELSAGEAIGDGGFGYVGE